MHIAAATQKPAQPGKPLPDGYYWVRMGELGEPVGRLPWELLELHAGHWVREQCDLRSVVDVGDRLEAQQLPPPRFLPG